MVDNPFRDLGDGLKRQQREFRLQVACVEHLRNAYPGLLYFHIPNRPGSGTDGYMKKMMGAVAGAPDLVITWLRQAKTPDGYIWPIAEVAAIELKAPGGSISSAQNKMLSALAHRGWKTEVCRSVGELDTRLRAWGLAPAHNGIKEPCYDSQHEKFAKGFAFYAEDSVD